MEYLQIVWEYLKVSALLIGVGVVLHYYAYGIAWGVAKGWAKVTHVTRVVNEKSSPE